MSIQDLGLAMQAIDIMNRKFGWRECTTKERLEVINKRELPRDVYKMLNIKRTKKGITFFLWFADDEIIEVMVNKYACDAYDVSDVWRTLI